MKCQPDPNFDDAKRSNLERFQKVVESIYDDMNWVYHAPYLEFVCIVIRGTSTCEKVRMHGSSSGWLQ